MKTRKHGLVKHVLSKLMDMKVTAKGMPQTVTSSPHPLHAVPLQFHAQRIVEGRELDQGEVADLLHVLGREVPNLRQAKAAFPNNEFLWWRWVTSLFAQKLQEVNFCFKRDVCM